MNYLGIDKEIFQNGLNDEISEFIRKAISLGIPVFLVEPDYYIKGEKRIEELKIKNGKIVKI